MKWLKNIGIIVLLVLNLITTYIYLNLEQFSFVGTSANEHIAAIFVGLIGDLLLTFCVGVIACVNFAFTVGGMTLTILSFKKNNIIKNILYFSVLLIYIFALLLCLIQTFKRY